MALAFSFLQQVLLPGHLLMRFTREKLEDCLAAVKDGIARDVARAPEAVNLQVAHPLPLSMHRGRCGPDPLTVMYRLPGRAAAALHRICTQTSLNLAP